MTVVIFKIFVFFFLLFAFLLQFFELFAQSYFNIGFGTLLGASSGLHVLLSNKKFCFEFIDLNS